ncbi:MAG: hypothetical protein AAFV53_37520, partial [Myxococcota bacterium]
MTTDEILARLLPLLHGDVGMVLQGLDLLETINRPDVIQAISDQITVTPDHRLRWSTPRRQDVQIHYAMRDLIAIFILHRVGRLEHLPTINLVADETLVKHLSRIPRASISIRITSRFDLNLLPRLAQQHCLMGLQLNKAQNSDADFAVLSDLSDLTSLTLSRCHHLQDVAWIAQLRKLQQLSLN